METWTHLVRFVATEDGKIHLGQLVDTSRDVGLDVFNGIPVKAYRLQGLILDARMTSDVLTVAKLLSPIAMEDCPYIRCIGMNYSEHANELDTELPRTPNMFTKPRTSLADPFPAPISISHIAQDQSSDYEAELCVVIGKAGRNIPKEKAFEYILGYTASNDVSARTLQMESQQWSFSKGLDSACPIGPVLVAASAIPDPQQLEIHATYNGALVQADTTRNMLFGVADLVSYLSQGTTLEPGSLILTGTPKGVGFKRNPKIYLQDEDDIRIHIEKIGTLINKIKYEDW